MTARFRSSMTLLFLLFSMLGVAHAAETSQGKSLPDLVGAAEISVFADVERSFARYLEAYQSPEEEMTQEIDAADMVSSIQAGRDFNFDSRAAKAVNEQARHQTRQALGSLLPNVSIRTNSGYEISEPSVVVDDATGDLLSSSTHIRTDYTLTVVQPLFNLPTYLDWRRRKENEQATEQRSRISEGDAYVATVSAYLELVSSRLQAEVARDLEAELADLLKYIEKRAGAGAASVSDMARVRARSESILSTRLELESAHRAAGTEFVRLTNIVPKKVRLPVLEDVGISILPKSLDVAVQTALESNPEIASLVSELTAEEINVRLAEGRYLPRIDAELTDTYSERAGGSDTPQRDKRAMLVLSWNLYAGGRDYYYKRERDARRKELQYRLADQRRQTVQALSSNYATLALTGKRILSGYQELESITTAADAMSKRMLSGNQSLLDLLDVLNQRYQARSRLVGLHALEMGTVAQLIRLTHGTPWADAENAAWRVDN